MDTIQKCENTFFSIAKGSTSASGKKKKKRFIVIMMKGKLTNWYIGKKKLFDKGQKEIAILSKILSNVLILLELYFMYIFMKCHQSIFSSQLVTAMSVKLLV